MQAHVICQSLYFCVELELIKMPSNIGLFSGHNLSLLFEYEVVAAVGYIPVKSF
jgi:hypothetical protein